VPRITVATATASDLDVVMSIWAAADATRRRPAGPARAARVREEVRTGELVLLAHYGARPAGIAVAETFVADGSPDPSTGHIAMICVDPAVWGSRVGTSLLADLQARWTRLSTWTRTDNRRAQRLYLGAGFTDSGHRSRLQDGAEIMQLVWG
jgi:ribosomal protein S18 acetylase RimI-like enzyme